ncbi:hypothetical protein CEG14_12795 [Bordetella genomosp. 1]|uniref:DUF1508 domain-containing protein n=1 Tax=Bordetella genomosp. 1 TaxID=1395607 RepID=A0A261SFY8_9BORD|nr:YegP family protein [Bordetella genomosp. 1]MDQ8032127.1 YegP family protein [Bordetella sp.]OZI35917.1 hypothetical protein CEG14_12795 [Bordetella genomosp. 1]OZI58584.1 hypothetical protein CAL27_18005 [Bordetella genomosp. 1]
MAGWFELKQGSTGQFHFTLKASNGEVILSSETYTTKASAQKGIDSVRENCFDATRYNRAQASNGRYFFTLRAGNGQVIGNSQMYTSEAARDGGIDSVRNNGLTQALRQIA